MKIALAQINTQIGDLSGNASKVVDFARRAAKKGAELVVFPELTLSGYPPRDLLEKPHFNQANLKALKEVASRIRGICAVVGFAEPNPEPTGRPVFNSAAFLQGGRVTAVRRKILLPTYDVFDESRHFEAGKEAVPFLVSKTRVGLSICEDLWSDELFWGRKIYSLDPIASLSERGIDLLINLSASPYARGKQQYRRDLLSKTARRFKVPIVYVNLVGGNDDLIFDGASMAVDKNGRVCLEMKSFEEDLAIIDPERLNPRRAPQQKDIELTRRALVLGIRDYMKKTGFKKAVLGLSGGIDSATVALLAVEACGAKNVLGVSMPSPFSTKESVSFAKAIAQKLKIGHRTLPIGPLYQDYQSTLKLKHELKNVDVTRQNIQARIRGNLLMALSNKEGYLLLSTGNKSEMAVGYCTLYGDMAGGLAVISDLPKTQVYELAAHLNKTHRAIPPKVFKKPASPELAPGQKTQDDLPPFKILDEVLRRYVEENQGLPEIVAAGFSPKVVREILRKVDRNEYKRKQAPPGLRVTAKAFGTGRRIPLTNAFQE